MVGLFFGCLFLCFLLGGFVYRVGFGFGWFVDVRDGLGFGEKPQ